MAKSSIIDLSVARALVDTQFPEWSHLPLTSVNPGGWDNRTFRLGDELAVRIPGSVEYAAQPLKEHRWLPKLAAQLSLSITIPVVLGSPSETCPWFWTVYKWLPGDPAGTGGVRNPELLAKDLAAFIRELESIDPSGGPEAGAHSFFRGAHLSVYDAEARRAIAALSASIDASRALQIWESANETEWHRDPVWVHGDVSAGNLLLQGDRLSAVIDFGCLAVGDPSCDLAIAWSFFDPISRDVFRRGLGLDDATWSRGRAWALWKAAIIAAGMAGTSALERRLAWPTLRAVCEDAS